MRVANVRPNVIAALSQRKEVASQVRAVATEVRNEARRRAPKRTGAGARSIKVQRHFDTATRAVSFQVSWDRDHFYMGFHELGTEQFPAQGFLRGAARAVEQR